METMRVAGIQMGPYTGDYQSNMSNALAALDKVVKDFKPDIVCFSELMTVPYFACVRDHSWFQHAEPIPGKTTNTFFEVAKKHDIHIIATTFEKAGDKYYNSAFLVSPTQGVKGVYRKTHIPKVGDPTIVPLDEQYYFSPGDSIPVFDLKGVKIGILICFDRSIPETFRILMLKGVKVVFLPVASIGPRKDAFWEELKVMGMQNHLFIVAVNKAGNEICKGEKHERYHFGRSCIVDPMGSIIASLEDEPFGVLTGTIDLKLIDAATRIFDWVALRRPKLYQVIAET